MPGPVHRRSTAKHRDGIDPRLSVVLTSQSLTPKAHSIVKTAPILAALDRCKMMILEGLGQRAGDDEAGETSIGTLAEVRRLTSVGITRAQQWSRISFRSSSAAAVRSADVLRPGCSRKTR
jgi:hypothetical protein